MAQSAGTYSGRSAFQLRMDAIEASVNTANNTSDVDIHLYAICVDAAWDSYDATAGAWAAHYHGQNWSGNKALDFRNSYTGQYISLLGPIRLTVAHDDNGDMSTGFYASHSSVGQFGSASCSTVVFALTKIWRPPTTDSTYYAQSITTTSARTANIIANARGGTLSDVQVQRNTSATDVGATLHQSGSWADCDMTGLTRGTLYYFRVRIATTQYGWGTWGSWKSFTTLAVAPTLGSAYTAGTITRNSAVISGFNIVDNGGEAPSNLRVQYNTSATDAGATVVTQGSWNSVTVSGLAALTTYYYRAAAYNSAGWGPYVETWKSFTTLNDAPDDMAAPTFSAVGDTAMRVNWVAPAMNGATFVAYKYDISLVDTFASVVATGTTSALFVDLTGLTPGTRYYVRVRANATPNNGGYGTAYRLTTGFAPNSGLRVYAIIGGVVEQGELYTFVDGVRKKLTTMYAHDGVVETE